MEAWSKEDDGWTNVRTEEPLTEKKKEKGQNNGIKKKEKEWC